MKKCMLKIFWIQLIKMYYIYIFDYFASIYEILHWDFNEKFHNLLLHESIVIHKANDPCNYQCSHICKV